MDRLKGVHILLSRIQALPDRTAKQRREDTSLNCVQAPCLYTDQQNGRYMAARIYILLLLDSSVWSFLAGDF